MRIFEYYGRYEGFRARVGGFGFLERGVLFLAAVPGLVLMALSLVALGVSILALLLLTVPVYRLLVALRGGWGRESAEMSEQRSPDGMASPGRRQVEVKIINETQAGPVGDRLPNGAGEEQT